MRKRATRIFKAQVNSLLDKLEQPEKILKQIVRDSKSEIFKLYGSANDIRVSIDKMERALKKAKETGADSSLIEQTLEKYKEYEKKFEEKIIEYKDKVIRSEAKIKILQAKAESIKAMLEISKKLSSFDPDGLDGTLERMEEKIAKMEMQLETYDELENIF
jgi:phage shock protein A